MDKKRRNRAKAGHSKDTDVKSSVPEEKTDGEEKLIKLIREELVRQIIIRDINIEDKDGRLLLELALKSIKEQVKQILRPAGESTTDEDTIELEGNPSILDSDSELEDVGSLQQRIPKYSDTYVCLLKLLEIFLNRGISHRYAVFLKSTNLRPFEFSCLGLKYLEGDKTMHRIIWFKFESKILLNASSVFSKDEGSLSLKRWFYKYKHALNKSLYKDGIVKDVILCGNVHFDFQSLTDASIKVTPISVPDKILYRENDSFVKFCSLDGNASLLARKWETGELRDIEEFLKKFLIVESLPTESKLEEMIESNSVEEFDPTSNEYSSDVSVLLSAEESFKERLILPYVYLKSLIENVWYWRSMLFDLKGPTDSFTGRRKELETLHNLLQGNGRYPAIVALIGVSGVGKTQLVRKYTYENSHFYNHHIVWIDATNYQTLANSFRKLAIKKLKLHVKNTGADSDMKSVIEDTYMLFSETKCLFVFDNVTQFQTEKAFDNGIDKFLPLLPDGFHNTYMIVTSQNYKISWPKHFRRLELNMFDEKEATDFVNKSLSIQNNSQVENVKELVESCVYFPLALDRAIAYIKAQDSQLKLSGLKFEISNFLRLIKGKHKEILDFDIPGDRDNVVRKAINRVFTITCFSANAIIKLDNGEDAVDILKFIAYFAPEDIPIAMFKKYFKNSESSIELLKQYSIIDVRNAMFDVHRLVQTVTRISLRKENKEEQVLSNSLKIFNNMRADSKNLHLVTYVWKYCWKYVKLLPDFALLSTHIGYLLISQVRLEDATIFGFNLLKLLWKGKADCPPIAAAMAMLKDIALSYKNQKKYERALDILIQTLVINEKTSESTSSIEFEIKKLITILLEVQNNCEKHDQIEKIIRSNVMKLIDPYDRLFKRDDIVTALYYKSEDSNLLEDIQSLIESKKDNDSPANVKFGERLLKVISKIKERQEHLSERMRYEYSLQMYELLLSGLEKFLGIKHKFYLQLRNVKGLILLKLDRAKEAVTYLNETLRLQKGIFRETDPSTLCSLNNLGIAFSSLDLKKSAVLMFEQLLLRSQEDIEGMNNLGVAYEKLNYHLYANNTFVSHEKLLAKISDNSFRRALAHTNIMYNRYRNNHLGEALMQLALLTDVMVDKVNLKKVKDSTSTIRKMLLLLQTVASNQKIEANDLQACNVNAADAHNRSLLHIAILNRNFKNVSLLLKKGADVNWADNDECKPIHYATYMKDLRIVQELFKHVKSNLYGYVNSQTIEMKTPLHIAAQSDFPQLVRAILENGASFDIRDRFNFLAIDYSENDEVNELLQTIEQLFIAAEFGNLNAIRKLNDDELASVKNVRNHKGYTITEIASLFKQKKFEKKIKKVYNYNRI